MANIKEVCILLVVGFIVISTADPFIGRLGFFSFHRLRCLFKRCHRYAKCQIQMGKAVCVCPKVCPKNSSPVCGTDWKTYNNYCELTRASCVANSRTRLRYYGPCKSGSCRRSPWQSLRCPYYSTCQLIFGLPRCVCPQNCSFRYKPVCGSDDRTYANSCELRKTACKRRRMLFIQHSGHCRPDPCARLNCCCGAECRVNLTNHAKCECNFACTLQYDPVCGSDGRTYGNACGLRSAACAQQNPKLKVVSNGPCPTSGPATLPVTTLPDTTTVPDTTPLDPCITVKCQFYAKCEIVNGSAACVCPLCGTDFDIVQPVCGSNGRTYANVCHLQRDSCQTSQLIRVVSKGPCATETPVTSVPTTVAFCPFTCGFYSKCEVRNGTATCVCPSLCPGVVAPVCGSNGVTYENLCELKRDSCKKYQHIQVANNGECLGSNLKPVTRSPPTTISPCASIRCGFFAKCEVRNGSAGCVCPEICPSIINPVCGSDGVTYANTCELEKASCKQQKQITVVKKGGCDKIDAVLSCPIPKICLVFCDKDECAKNGQICCCKGCGNVCTTPIKKSGRNVCPPDPNACLLDKDCPNGKKCCLDGCTKRCVTPVATMVSEMKELKSFI